MTPTEVQERLTKILRRLDPERWKAPKMLSISMIYNTRNAYARPGRDLANAIAELTRNKVPTTSWPAKAVRPRRTPAKRRKAESVDKAA